ncbi:ABC transporter, CydDC cysteine exporter (CydDC-E) family, permease/ATP-binding protein CydD [Novosphingobium sp. Rr 2-17]|uniref:thiol reductant ABC exporter subunit CydD n=1 Tax=Novosphingobium sp. Rr 2-17 TaxID=555793 RepID=UPI0002697E53|nr:thiol reductant ABC exporter subunit CydD [Novosphingobium sp. Rr 2-17]EIZ80750.1 ABC transporter, CydDC cysteine exporter (CydDC-E) family, permease/ATP-binding protein CydD [Novosphingobium sp. Rr 2-17]
MSTTLLLLDTVGAIGFAGGIAGAISTAANGAVSIEAWPRLGPWLALMLAAGLLRGVCASLSAQVGAKDAFLAKRRLRQRIVGAALRQPVGQSDTGTLTAAVVDEVEAIDGYVARFLPARRAAALGPLLVLIAAAWASPISAAILAFTLLPFVAAMILAGGSAADETRRQFAMLARLSGLFADRVRALPVVLAFRAEEAQATVIAGAAREAADRTLKVLAIAFLSSAALEFFGALSVALVAVYAGFNLLGLLPFPVPEHLDLAHAFFVLALAPEFYAPMRRLAAAYHDQQAAQAAAERLRGLEAAAVPIASRVSFTRPPALTFRSVSIRYSEGERDAVRDFSLSVMPGETVVLAGPSGCGKTSLLHALLGLAPITQGFVEVDGYALAPYERLPASWAGQSPMLLAGTLRENIALARPGASDAEIQAAAMDAGMAPVLATRGLDAVIDSRGSGLSGGERRRIGLARALLRDAPLLLLDEPTAHLDSVSEAALIATIAQVAKGRTVLIATHSERLFGIADHLVRLDIHE